MKKLKKMVKNENYWQGTNANINRKLKEIRSKNFINLYERVVYNFQTIYEILDLIKSYGLSYKDIIVTSEHIFDYENCHSINKKDNIQIRMCFNNGDVVDTPDYKSRIEFKIEYLVNSLRDACPDLVITPYSSEFNTCHYSTILLRKSKDVSNCSFYDLQYEQLSSLQDLFDKGFIKDFEKYLSKQISYIRDKYRHGAKQKEKEFKQINKELKYGKGVKR